MANPTQNDGANPETSRLTLVNQSAEMARINGLLDSLKEKDQLTDRDLFIARLCAEEVFTNIIMHGYEDMNDHAISFEIGVGAQDINMIFRDDGIPYDPRTTPEPIGAEDVLKMSPGGRGVALVISYASAVDYTYRDGHNCLSLTLPRESFK